MARWSWVASGSTWTNTTEQTASSGACRLHAIEIEPNSGQSAAAYVQLWDASGPTPGTTAPDYAIMIPTNTNRGLTRKIKAIFPNGGLEFATAITLFVATAAGGGTAVATTVIPQEIKLYFTPMA